jgi:hypothetical protein
MYFHREKFFVLKELRFIFTSKSGRISAYEGLITLKSYEFEVRQFKDKGLVSFYGLRMAIGFRCAMLGMRHEWYGDVSDVSASGGSSLPGGWGGNDCRAQDRQSFARRWCGDGGGAEGCGGSAAAGVE